MDMKRILAVAALLGLAGLMTGGRMMAQGTPVAGAVTVTGKLVKMMAVGGESSGWAIELENEQSFGGKPVKSIEVEGNAKKLAKLENKRVVVSGTILHRSGVERADRAVLEVGKIKEWK
jgi:hypothetical protein